MSTPVSVTPTIDPLMVLKGFAALRRLAGAYPPGHPAIGQKVRELDDAVQGYLSGSDALHIDVIEGGVHVDGVAFSRDPQGHGSILKELSDLGVDSIHIRQGVTREELLAVAEFLWRKDVPKTEPVESQLAARGVSSVSLGRLVPLDTKWRAQQWPDAPTGVLDPDYAESLARAQETFEQVAAGRRLDALTVRDLVRLLITRVARSNAALGQILAVKQYENLTYCHSVNVAMLSLLIGRQIALDDSAMAALVEAALLHDIGKTRIPLEIVKKPGALDKHERRMIEAHTTLGAELLVQAEGMRPLTPTVALEHHRGVKGNGYPDLGSAVPHMMSQIVSVADIYEAMTGARSYQAPMLPEHACLVLARLAGDKLNTALVKSFVNAITFFPLGSLVRTNRGEVGVVIETNGCDPLHPVLLLVDGAGRAPSDRLDTAVRDGSGACHRHIVETLTPPDGFDLRPFLPAAA